MKLKIAKSFVFQLLSILSIVAILSCNRSKEVGYAEVEKTNSEVIKKLVKPKDRALSIEDSIDIPKVNTSTEANELISMELGPENNPSRLNVIEFKKIEDIARKDAEDRYSDHNIRGSIRGDSTFLFVVDNKNTYSQEYFLRYDYKTSFVEEIDLRAINPYREFVNYDKVEGTIHQMLGNNIIVNGTKEKIKESIPETLYDLTPNDYVISAINPFVVSDLSPDKTKIVLRYSFHLLPTGEILEHQTYPGINTYLILDVNTGEEISKIEDLSFVPTEEVITRNNEYLIITHSQDLKDSEFSTNEADWKHQASIYSLKTGKLCFRKEGKNECNCIHRTVNGLTEIFLSGFQCYDEYDGQDSIKNFFVMDNSVIVRDVSLKEGIGSKYSTKDYYSVETIDRKLIKYFYETDFTKIHELCK